MSPGWTEEIEAAVPTQGGLLQIVSVGDGGQLRLNGRLLREVDESDASVVAQWPPQGAPRFLLIDLPEDGGSCPDLYRLLDVSAGQKPVLTRTFGNCSPSPSMTLRGDGVETLFPAFAGSPQQVWIYDRARRRLQNPQRR